MKNQIDVCFDSNTYSVLKFVNSQIGIREICYLPDFLSIGDISSIGPDSRKRELLRYAGPDAISSEFEELYSSFLDKLPRSKNVRAWVSHDDHELIGLTYLASIVGETTTVECVCAPKPSIGTSFDMLIDGYLRNEKDKNPIDIDRMKSEWNALVCENSPLRVIEDGIVKSVEESYFDCQILESARLLGSDLTASSIAMDVNVRREEDSGSMFPFYFLAKRAMKLMPEIKL